VWKWPIHGKLLDVAADVAIHDLHVVDVEEQFHAGRVDALANVDAPGDVVADLIEPAEGIRREAAVHDLHADGHAFVFGMRFEPVQDGDAVIGTFGVGHAAALTADGDDVRAAALGAIVDDGVQSLSRWSREVLCGSGRRQW
jgi:hypothetical protein